MSIRVSLEDRSYAIQIADSYGQLPAQLEALGLPKHGWIVSHRALLQRYGRALLGPLERAGWSLTTLTIPESESSKSLKTLQQLVHRLAPRAAMRVPVLLAFGGGVVGDVTGFVAAVFRRGVPYIQLPTTLLAQVDSAIGGKVGVDLPEGKNLLGAFYQPRLVYNHIGVLRSLSMRQRRSGLAEVIKYGVIADPALFAFLEAQLAACLSLQSRAVRVMVERSCRIKASVVSRDERDTGTVRLHLNFGHTLGHALEAAGKYRRWTHGEAIAIGMCAASRLSVEMGWLPEREHRRIIRLIQMAGLPTRATGIVRQRVLSALKYDKKFIHGCARWVLPRRIGLVGVSEAVPDALARRVLGEHLR